jgi:ABC-type transport system involved in multi-copper enzyme maturation permease subunit
MGLFPILPLSGAIVLLIMAIFVYTRNKNSPINVSYVLFLSSLILWLIGLFISYLTKSQKIG